MKQINKKQFHIIFDPILIMAIIVLIQFSDSFCMGLFDKMQSFLLKDFFMDSRKWNPDSATAYLNLVMLPCYAITATAPAVRALTDKYGKTKILFFNLFILINGCSLCMFSSSLFMFLIGNALITFSCTMDLQYLYIVEELPYKYRGTICGLTHGISACSAMLIPVLRNALIIQAKFSWHSIYKTAFFLTLCTGMLSAILLKLRSLTTKASHTSSNTTIPVKSSQPTNIKELLQLLSQNPNIFKYLIALLILGIATPAITFYNEPLISFSLSDMHITNQILLIQPIVTLIFTFLNGFASDHLSRKTVIIADISITLLSVLAFIINLHHSPQSNILGIAWGLMIGAYFSATELLNLIIMEQVPKQNIGKFSALSTYAYGFGDAIGMLVIGLLTLKNNMEISKLLLTIPTLCITLLIIRVPLDIYDSAERP